jgi:hypothetical protein
MSTSSSSDDLQGLRELASQWGKIISRQAFGDEGPDTDVDLNTMEHVAQIASQGLLEGILETVLEQQAKKLGDQQPCPDCGRVCLVRREPRSLVFRGATVEYAEPVCHCPACRRDFFPSTLPPGFEHASL